MRSRALFAVAVCVIVVPAVAAGVVASSTNRDTPASAGGIETCAALPYGDRARACYVEHLLELDADGDSVVDAAATLMDNPDVGTHFVTECHEVMHEIGEVHARRGLPPEVVSIDDSCLIGYAHGALAVWTADADDDALLDATLAFCPPDVSSSVCEHLAGHVLWDRQIVSGERDIVAALEHCRADQVTLENFPPGAEDDPDHYELYPEQSAALQCAGGAFMERVITWTGVDGPWRGTAADVFDSCGELNDFHPVVSSLCMLNVGALLYIAADFDDTATVVSCRGIVDVGILDGHRRCVVAALSLIASLAELDVDWLIDFCDQFDGDERRWCAAGSDLTIRIVRGSSATVGVCAALLPDDSECVRLSFNRFDTPEARVALGEDMT